MVGNMYDCELFMTLGGVAEAAVGGGAVGAAGGGMVE